MPSVTRSTQRSRRDETRGRVLAATEELLNNGENFTELSVERLATVAGISRSTFYVHFEDKSELALRLATAVLADMEAVSTQWWSTAEHADQDQLRAALAAIIDVYRRRGPAFTAVVETAAYDEAVADEVRTLMRRVIDAARSAIDRGKAAGVMRPVESAETAAVLTWMVERAGYQLVRGGDPAADVRVVAAITDVIWSTLYRL
jgi:AcrR family transcriptional regulator